MRTAADRPTPDLPTAATPPRRRPPRPRSAPSPSRRSLPVRDETKPNPPHPSIPETNPGTDPQSPRSQRLAPLAVRAPRRTAPRTPRRTASPVGPPTRSPGPSRLPLPRDETKPTAPRGSIPETNASPEPQTSPHPPLASIPPGAPERTKGRTEQRTNPRTSPSIAPAFTPSSTDAPPRPDRPADKTKPIAPTSRFPETNEADRHKPFSIENIGRSSLAHPGAPAPAPGRTEGNETSQTVRSRRASP